MLLTAALTSALALVPSPGDDGATTQASSKERAAAPERAEQKTDPFQPHEKVRRALAGEERDDGFVPLAGGVALPTMKLKGLVKMKGKPTAAAVDVDGVGSFVVREGEKIVFSLAGRVVAPRTAGGKTGAVEMREQIPIALLVKTISRDGVVVEVGTLGETLIIK